MGGPSKTRAVVSVTPLPAPIHKVSVSVAAPVAGPAAPKVSPVQAVFVEGQRATFYSVAVAAPGQGTVRYEWRLTPPKDNRGCNKFSTVPGSRIKAVWHHADTDGCTHNGFQHNGTVTVTVTTAAWRCVATFFGTLTKTGPPAQRCVRA
jgi:hypothetical protein